VNGTTSGLIGAFPAATTKTDKKITAREMPLRFEPVSKVLKGESRKEIKKKYVKIRQFKREAR